MYVGIWDFIYMCVSIYKYTFKILKLDFFTGKAGNCRPKQKKKFCVESLSSFLLKPPRMYFEK